VTDLWDDDDPEDNTCVLDRLTDFDRKTCINEDEFYAENARRGMKSATQTINRLLCVQIDNSPSTGRYFDTVDSVSLDSVNNRVEDNVEYSDRMLEHYVADNDEFETGDRLTSQLGDRLLSTWPVPASDSYGECSDMNVAQWLIEGEYGPCVRTALPSSVCMSSLNAELYTTSLKVRERLKSGSYLDITDVTVSAADYTSNTLTSATGTLSTSLSGCSCNNALLEAHYLVYVGSDFESITKVTASVVVSTVSSCSQIKIRQKFSIKFLSADLLSTDSSADQEPVFRSGNPGYLTSKPLIAAQFDGSNFNVFTDGFFFDGTSTDGSCIAEYTGRYLDAPRMTFRDETIFTCSVSLNYQQLQTFCSGTLSELPIFSLHSSLTHLGKFGKIVYSNSDDWVEVVVGTSDTTLELVGDTCTLPSILSYKIITADIGSVTNPQPKIVYATRDYEKG
jgi:hypothetical protein